MFDFLRDVQIDTPKIDSPTAPAELRSAVEATAQALSEWRTAQQDSPYAMIDSDEYIALHSAHYTAVRDLAAYELATIEPMITPLRPGLDKAEAALRKAYTAYMEALQRRNVVAGIIDTKRAIIADCDAKLAELQPVRKGARVTR